MAFTSKQKKMYIDAKGRVCPYCESSHIDSTTELEWYNDGTIDQEIECFDCGRLWKDVYKLINVLEEGEMR